MKHHCPDEETLAAYFDGLLSPVAESALHGEMLRCDDCVALVGALGLVLRAEDPGAFATAPAAPEAVTRSAIELWPTAAPLAAIRIAVRWLGERLQPLADALQPQPQPGGAMRGGGGEPQDLRFQVTLGDLPLELDLESDGPHRLSLTVRPLRPPPAGALLRLATEGQTRALSSLGADGTTVPALPPGDYRLSIEHRDRPLGQLDLALVR